METNRIPCSLCEKAYAERKNLLRHLKGRHGAKLPKNGNVPYFLEGDDLIKAKAAFSKGNLSGPRCRKEKAEPPVIGQPQCAYVMALASDDSSSGGREIEIHFGGR